MTQNTKQTNKTLWKVVKLSELFWERKTTLQEQQEDTKGWNQGSRLWHCSQPFEKS